MLSLIALLISKPNACPCAKHNNNCFTNPCPPEYSRYYDCYFDSELSNYYGKECQDYIKCHPGVDCDTNRSQTSSLIRCPSSQPSCIPYLEFTRIVEFFVSIPSGKRLLSS